MKIVIVTLITTPAGITKSVTDNKLATFGSQLYFLVRNARKRSPKL